MLTIKFKLSYLSSNIGRLKWSKYIETSNNTNKCLLLTHVYTYTKKYILFRLNDLMLRPTVLTSL